MARGLSCAVLLVVLGAASVHADDLVHSVISAVLHQSPPPAAPATPVTPAPPATTATPASTTPGPYVIPPVIVTTPLPVQSSPPVTTLPVTSGPPTTSPPPTTVFVSPCNATQFYVPSNKTCLACGKTSNNGTTCSLGANFFGGRCDGAGNCLGAFVNFCPSVNAQRYACPSNPSVQAYCDPAGDPNTAAAAQASGNAGVYNIVDSDTTIACNFDRDCPNGFFCNGYSSYRSTGFAGLCAQTC